MALICIFSGYFTDASLRLLSAVGQVVDDAKARALAAKLKSDYMPTSAKEGTNVDEAFQWLAERVSEVKLGEGGKGSQADAGGSTRPSERRRRGGAGAKAARDASANTVALEDGASGRRADGGSSRRSCCA